jgi:hypothetical protein
LPTKNRQELVSWPVLLTPNAKTFTWWLLSNRQNSKVSDPCRISRIPLA